MPLMVFILLNSLNVGKDFGQGGIEVVDFKYHDFSRLFYLIFYRQENDSNHKN